MGSYVFRSSIVGRNEKNKTNVPKVPQVSLWSYDKRKITLRFEIGGVVERALSSTRTERDFSYSPVCVEESIDTTSEEAGSAKPPSASTTGSLV